MSNLSKFLTVVATLLLLPSSAGAHGAIMERNISMAMALAVAQGAIEKCLSENSAVTVAVVDRGGHLKVMLRADDTPPHQVEISRRKAYTARVFRQTSVEFTQRTANQGPHGLRSATDVIAGAGGVPIKVGNDVIGAVGVSGATGQGKDEGCAMAGIARVADQLRP